MPAEKRPVFAGNWKLFGTLAESVALATDVQGGAAGVSQAQVIIAPSFLAIAAVVKRLEGGPVSVAGQDCHWESKGAFTGEVSPGQLADAGCRHVIVGHSERRQLMGELDADVNRKTRAALVAGLSPIVCIGETLAERDAGTTLDLVGRQLDAGLADVSEAEAARCLIAYEPVWAIGTGRTASPAQAEEVHRFIRTQLAAKFPGAAAGISLLYGGSVKPDNIRALMAEENVDGALVGGASLVAASFVSIVKEGTEVWLRS
ncbi:MAG: triose-phosphate isomerase [Myxococcales bacterium]